MAELGRRLQQARQEAGITLEILAQRTKIPQSMLEAIEREDFARLPGGLFTRGFLRAYAREVGLEPEAIIHDYSAEYETRPESRADLMSAAEFDESPPAASPELQRRRASHDDQPPPRLRRSAGASAKAEASARSRAETPAGRYGWTTAALIAGLVAYLFLLPAERPEQLESGAVGTSGQDELAATLDAPASNRAVDPLVEQAQPAMLTLEIHPKQEVWVDIQADGERVLRQLIQPGQREIVQARDEILARIGDAAAFEYSVNGKPGALLGAPGQVRDIRITHQKLETGLPNATDRTQQ